MSDDQVEHAARQVLAAAQDARLMVATAESCTGGLVAAALTAIAGSSAVVDRGFVTYSNEAKQEMLGVPPDHLARFGAVSAETAAAMARGAVERSCAGLAVAVSGIAGPGGGSPDKPVGLVHFCVATRSGRSVPLERRYGDLGRAEIRRRSVIDALDLLLRALRTDLDQAGARP